MRLHVRGESEMSYVGEGNIQQRNVQWEMSGGKECPLTAVNTAVKLTYSEDKTYPAACNIAA
jgi:hypothetical protein